MLTSLVSFYLQVFRRPSRLRHGRRSPALRDLRHYSAGADSQGPNPGLAGTFGPFDSGSEAETKTMAQNTHQARSVIWRNLGKRSWIALTASLAASGFKGRWSRGAVAIGATGAGGARASLGRQSTCNEEEAQ